MVQDKKTPRCNKQFKAWSGLGEGQAVFPRKCSPCPWFPPAFPSCSLQFLTCFSPESVSLINHFTHILGSTSASRRIQLKSAGKQKYRPTAISTMYELCCCLYASHCLRACQWLSCSLSAYSQGHS